MDDELSTLLSYPEFNHFQREAQALDLRFAAAEADRTRISRISRYMVRIFVIVALLNWSWFFLTNGALALMLNLIFIIYSVIDISYHVILCRKLNKLIIVYQDITRSTHELAFRMCSAAGLPLPSELVSRHTNRARQLSYILSSIDNERVFSPMYEEIYENHVIALAHETDPRLRRQLTFRFTVQTTLLVVQCLWVVGSDNARTTVVKAVARALGDRAVTSLRSLWAVWFGRLP